MVFLAYLFFLSIVGFVINFGLFQRDRNIYVQKVKYMNEKLAFSDIKSFRLRKEFFATLKYNESTMPFVIDKYLENQDYQYTVSQFERRKKQYRRINITLTIILVLSYGIGMVLN